MTYRMFVGLIVILGVLLVLLYGNTFGLLMSEWDRNVYYSHGYLILPLASWLIWRKRQVLAETSNAPSWAGLIILVLGLFLYFIGISADILFLQGFSFIFVLAGMIGTVWGLLILNQLLFPLFILVFMIPLPYLLLDPIGFPMKQAAASLSANILQSFGVPVMPDGVYLFLPNYTLVVEDVCNGLRSLISMTTVSVVLAYVLLRSPTDRFWLVFLSIPISLVANVIRIILTAILGYYVSDSLAQGFLHELSGLFVFLVSLGGLLLLEKILTWRREDSTSEPLSV